MPTFPIEPNRLPQGDPNRYPQNAGGGFSWNIGYASAPRQPETRRPSVTVPTWYPPVMAQDDGRLNAVDLGEQGWRNRPHQAMDFSGGDGGSIWEGSSPTVEINPVSPLSPFQEPSFEWNGSDAPVGEPIVETPTDQNPTPLPPDEPLFADISNRNVLPSTPTSTEWTTSPTERRFLPSRSPDIRSFGNDLTLGEFLNTPLTAMRYGEGYGAGSGDVTYADTTTHAPGSEISPEEQAWYEAHGMDVPPTSTGTEDLPTGQAVSPDVRRGELVGNDVGSEPYFPPTTSWTEPSMHFNYASGHMVPDSTADPMSGEDYGGNAYAGGRNFMGTTGDEGHTDYALQLGRPTWVLNRHTGAMEQTGPIWRGAGHPGSNLGSGMTDQQISYARQLLASNFNANIGAPATASDPVANSVQAPLANTR